MWWHEKGKRERQTQAGLPEEGPRVQLRVKSDCPLVYTKNEKTVTQDGFLPSLKVSFSQPPAPSWLSCHPVSSQGPSARPHNTSRLFHTRSPSVPTPVLTRPWGPSGAQNPRVHGHWHWVEGCGPLAGPDEMALPSRWFYRVPQPQLAPHCSHHGQKLKAWGRDQKGHKEVQWAKSNDDTSEEGGTD